MSVLELRQEFQTRHMRTTAIELSNRQNTGWAQRKNAADLLDITYPTGDVRRALDAVSAAAAGKPIVMIGQRGSGKSHIMALVHHSFGSPEAVESWGNSWGQKLQSDKLLGLRFNEDLYHCLRPCLTRNTHICGTCFSNVIRVVPTIVESSSSLGVSYRQSPCCKTCSLSRRPH